ncbi:uncharacterized protein LOC110014714 [Scomber scombrus]|uniref:Uncharacterized protein LOC110014714 n=1 Tax=Scomber scombrus TaxID=13677 RepID=A0AAV1P533_SCOSC
MKQVKLWSRNCQKLTDTLDKIASSLEGQAKRINEAKQQVSAVDDQVASLKLRLAQVENRQVTMADQIDNAENCSRRDNIQILNLKEGMKGEHLLEFFESWLPTKLGLSTAKGCKDWTALIGPPGRGMTRPVILKLHNSQNKPWIMAAAGKAKNLEHEGSCSFIHQDLSNAVRLKHHSYNDVVRK